MEDVVIDTNVLVAAIRSSKGASYRLWGLLGTGLYRPVLTVPLFMEYEDVLKRPELNTVFSDHEMTRILNAIVSEAHLQEVYYLWRPLLKDPGDDHVLEAAVASKARRVITFNKKDFSKAEQFGITLSTPYEYLKEKGEVK
jgi:putative PIN family toxin of toxin-antitoxin system